VHDINAQVSNASRERSRLQWASGVCVCVQVMARLEGHRAEQEAPMELKGALVRSRVPHTRTRTHRTFQTHWTRKEAVCMGTPLVRMCPTVV
jgi:hypothetical protein